METIKIKTQEELNSILEKEKDRLVLLKFQTQWCWPCKMYGENIKNLPSEISDKLLLLEVDADEDDALDLVVSHDVRNVPVSIFYYDNKEVEKVSGLLTLDNLTKKIKKILKTL